MSDARFKPGTTICWRMISGCDLQGRPIYNDWAIGEVVAQDEDPDLLLVRRTSHPGGVVLVRKGQIVP